MRMGETSADPASLWNRLAAILDVRLLTTTVALGVHLHRVADEGAHQEIAVAAGHVSAGVVALAVVHVTAAVATTRKSRQALARAVAPHGAAASRRVTTSATASRLSLIRQPHPTMPATRRRLTTRAAAGVRTAVVAAEALATDDVRKAFHT